MILSFCGTKNAIIFLLLAQLDLGQKQTNAHLLEPIKTSNFDNEKNNKTEDNLLVLEDSELF